jgi:hypothetical protein
LKNIQNIENILKNIERKFLKYIEKHWKNNEKYCKILKKYWRVLTSINNKWIEDCTPNSTKNLTFVKCFKTGILMIYSYPCKFNRIVSRYKKGNKP